MNQFIGLLIFTISTGLVAVETLDSIQTKDSTFVSDIFKEVRNLHEIREYKHEQYAALTNKSKKDFESPYHLTAEDIDEIEAEVFLIFSREYKL